MTRAVLLTLFFAVFTAFAQAPPGAQGRIVSLKGTVVAKTSGGDSRNLRVNDPVQVGYELTTGENSEALIQTAWGSEVRIFPDSRLIYSEPASGLRGLVELFLGSVKVKVGKIGRRPNPHKMTTPTAVIAVRGTMFSVFVDGDGDTLVAVDEGLVSVANRANPAEEILLRQQERTWIRRGARPTPVRAFRGPSDAADLLPGLRRGANATGETGVPGVGLGRKARSEGDPPPGPPGLNRRR